jgi:hypothetical protein
MVFKYLPKTVLLFIILFFTTSQRKKFEVQLSELWTVDCGLSTIIRRFE